MLLGLLQHRVFIALHSFRRLYGGLANSGSAQTAFRAEEMSAISPPTAVINADNVI